MENQAGYKDNEPDDGRRKNPDTQLDIAGGPAKVGLHKAADRNNKGNDQQQG
jgi:hypothetical protein